MKSRLALILLTCTMLLTGCATTPQASIALSPATLSASGARVGVAMSRVPKVDTSFPGAGCLLCLAAASMTNSSLTTHTQTLPSDDLLRIKAEVADLLRKKGNEVIIIDEALAVDSLPNAANGAPNFANKDFSSLKSKYQLDKLLVIEIAQVGIVRTYSAYIPSGDPQGAVSGRSYLVNLKDNSYEWYLPLTQRKSATGKWDEAPSFPGLSNAYFQALEGTRDAITQPFN